MLGWPVTPTPCVGAPLCNFPKNNAKKKKKHWKKTGKLGGLPPHFFRTPRGLLIMHPARWAKHLLSVQLLQKTLEINTQSMDQLREILFKDVPTIRISDTFERPELATDLFEHDLDKLNTLRQLGAESFAQREAALSEFLSVEGS